jgi:hypothetical protein
MCDSEIECTLLPEKIKLRNKKKTYRDFRDWCDSSAPTGQLWVSLPTDYDSLLTRLFTITDRLKCTLVIVHFPTIKGFVKLYVTNRE